MFKPTITFITVMLLSVANLSVADSSANTQSDKPNGYHFKATLSKGSSSIRSVKLSWPVVSNLLQEDLKDLQVYNDAQQAVPFTIRSVASNKETQKHTRQLNFFPMGDIEKLGTILKHEADQQRYKAIKLIQTGQRYVIIDNSTAEDDKKPLPLQQMTLDWQGITHWLPKSLRVEASDDLTQWQDVSIEKLPYRMAKRDVILENNGLAFKSPVYKRFIRLSGSEDFEPLLKALKGVSGHYHNTSISRPLNWDSVDLTLTETTQNFRYDLPPSLPVKRWRLEALTPDSLYKGSLYTRSSTKRIGKKPADWQLSQSFLQYSIQMGDELVTSDSGQATNSKWSREWRINLEQGTNTATVPKLALAWEPLELIFIAQGQGPFQIRYASRTLQASTRMNLDKLLNEASPEAVKIESLIQLSEITAKEDEIQYKYLMWIFLAAAVFMLLYMAKGLLREMGKD